MKRCSWLFSVLLLSGCFLTQSKPPPQPVAKSGLLGVIAIEDQKGPQNVAAFVGMFVKKSAAQSAFLTRVDPREGAGCKISRKPRSQAATTYSSVGKVTLGSALQSTHVEVPEGKDHRYIMALPLEFPPGIFQVSVEGKDDIPAFRDLIRLPELLSDTKINDHSMGSSSTLLHKSDPLIATWQALKVPDSDLAVILDVDAITETEVVTLHCAQHESAVPVYNGIARWEIPSGQLAEIPETKDAFVYLIRALGRDTEDSGIRLIVQGLRTHVSQSEVAP